MKKIALYSTICIGLMIFYSCSNPNKELETKIIGNWKNLNAVNGETIETIHYTKENEFESHLYDKVTKGKFEIIDNTLFKYLEKTNKVYGKWEIKFKNNNEFYLEDKIGKINYIKIQ